MIFFSKKEINRYKNWVLLNPPDLPSEVQGSHITFMCLYETDGEGKTTVNLFVSTFHKQIRIQGCHF